MGISRFDVELDNPSKTYENGSVLSGKIYLDLDSPKPVKGIKLTVFGEAEISWTQTTSALEAKDVYPAECDRETYIDDDENYILGKDGPVVIPTGNHVYPFTYKLPEAIPASFDEELGKIEYKVKVTIQRAWYLWNHRESVKFDVFVPLDLNTDHKAAEPARHEISKKFMGCSEPVDLSVSLPVRGYIPGQTIPITVDIKNGAEVEIKGVYFTLIKLYTYHGPTKPRLDEQVIGHHDTQLPKNGQQESSIQHFLQIPEVPPSYQRHSKLIDLEYLIRVEVRVDEMHKNFEIDVPIIIGSVALLASTVAMANGNSNMHQNNDQVPAKCD
ncbi:arrestin domain-containing protein 2-like [Diprion similis]|uniref:arrestin domain-containing protein 2-like n=1 Tax=Diprion similis TaxID=362088 RepID=UPI001EF8C6C8|nr:arrestin domain-containing protein 2-like [Diprion similis]